MRDYGKIAPQFWTGETGKRIRAAGREAQVIACYLMTCPSSTMLGLYYLPLPTLCHEVGCTIAGARKALQCLADVQFAYYDESSEFVWVPRMATFQIGDSLKPGDKRIAGIVNALQKLRTAPYFNNFLSTYREAYNLETVSPLEGPSKPLPSPSEASRAVDQEQRAVEQEQEHEQEISRVVATSTGTSVETWKAYAEAYRRRYGVEPVRNQSVNAMLCKLVKKLGADESPKVAAFFLSHQSQFYIAKMHPVNLLLADAEKLRTEWKTGRQVTNGYAAQVDRTSTNGQVFKKLIAEEEARHEQVRT